MVMATVLFYVFLIATIICGIAIFLNKRFRSPIHFSILIILIFSLIFLSQKGSKVFKFGALEVNTKEDGKEAAFKIKNTTNQIVKENIQFATSSAIENLKIDKGNNYISMIGGGKGNNYVVYAVSIPPEGVATGSIVSADTVSIIPQEVKSLK